MRSASRRAFPLVEIEGADEGNSRVSMRQQKAGCPLLLYVIWNGAERHKFFNSFRVPDIRPGSKTGCRFSAPDTATLGPFHPLEVWEFPVFQKIFSVESGSASVGTTRVCLKRRRHGDVPIGANGPFAFRTPRDAMEFTQSAFVRFSDGAVP
jgi:hypothetical protein